MKKPLFTFLVLLFVTSLQAQFGHTLSPCGTPDGRSEWLKEYQENPSAFPRSSQMLYVPMTVHIVGRDAGTGYFLMRSLLDALCILNENFEPVEMQFYIKSTHFKLPMKAVESLITDQLAIRINNESNHGSRYRI